jgi:superoxide dismutase, Cu-Zn family
MRAGSIGGALRSATGLQMGSAELRTTGTATNITLTIRDLPPGTYGAHIHAVGQCTTPTFASAGGHWNPTMREHGRLNPAGTHSGDLGNLTVGQSRRGTLTATVPGTIDALLDADGAAVIVHARRDDERTDPSGNSGDRIACAVITRN